MLKQWTWAFSPNLSMVATIKYDVTLKPRACLVKNAKRIIAYWGDIKKGSTLLIKVDPLVFEYLIFNLLLRFFRNVIKSVISFGVKQRQPIF